MGSGIWAAAAYDSTTAVHMAKGTTFAHTTRMAFAPREDRKAAEFLDPKRVNNAGVFEGRNVRESLDSVEHPTVTSIAVGFDVTGSNIDDARIVQAKLPTLINVIKRKGLIEHPQISIGAIGDANVDSVPLQFAPFESDNRIDDHLNNVFLEGGGGGNLGESYGLYLYYLANHTYLDSWEKRGKKGYAFVIADELCLDTSPRQLRDFVGVTERSEALSAEEAFRMAERQYEVFLLSTNATYQDSLAFYRNILGERAIDMTGNSDNVAEVIASLVRALEGDDFEEIDSDLALAGASSAAREAVGAALVSTGVSNAGGIAVTDTPSDLNGESGTERL